MCMARGTFQHKESIPNTTLHSFKLIRNLQFMNKMIPEIWCHMLMPFLWPSVSISNCAVNANLCFTILQRTDYRTWQMIMWTIFIFIFPKKLTLCQCCEQVFSSAYNLPGSHKDLWLALLAFAQTFEHNYSASLWIQPFIFFFKAESSSQPSISGEYFCWNSFQCEHASL